MVSRPVKVAAIVLIVFTGLLNFHVPHFVLESTTRFDQATSALEMIFLANLLGALVAAIGIYGNLRWAWFLGILIAFLSFSLYLAQETAGLPGLPKAWLEPSRIVSLIVEALYVALAVRQLALKRIVERAGS